MIPLTLRHLCRHWLLNVVVLLCLTLACGLAVSLSGYTDAIAARELSRTWDGAGPAQHSILIAGPRDSFDDALYANLQNKLGDLLKDRMVIRHAILTPDSPQVVTRLDVYSFDLLVENVRVIEGRLPDPVDLLKEPEVWRPPPIEAVVGARAAAQFGYRVGDRLTASGQYHRLNIVGIVEPVDSRADIWGGDLSAFEGITSTLPLIVDSFSMQTFYPMRPVFPHEISWRITLNPQSLSPNRAAALHSDLINFQTQAATVRAMTSTDLVRILAGYLSRLSRLRMALFLLGAQSLIFVLYALIVFASFAVDGAQAELATLSARGATAWQITHVFALENLAPAAMALFLGPAFALGAIRIWSESIGDAMPIAISGEVWIQSWIAAVLGWIALVLPIFLAARRNPLRWDCPRDRPPQSSAVQKYYLDLYLFVFGALLYWQLKQTDSFVMSRLGDTPFADPLLLIGPTILLISAAMVFLRVLPFALKFAARLVQNLRGVALSQSLFQLSRDSWQPGQAVLLVTLTTGLVLFTQTYANSLANSPEPMARYLARALQLNALALILFSATVFFLTQLFAAQRRVREFGVLHVLGLPSRRWLTLLILQGTLVLFPGLVTGAVVGVGLSRMMMPYLSRALSEWQLGIAVEPAVVSWGVVAQSYLLLIAAFGSALVILWLVLSRAGKQDWMGSE